MQDISLKQSHLEIVLKAVFPENKIISNARKQSNVINPQNKNAFELDVWLPEIKLAFEFQDPYHYISSGIFQDLLTLQKRDYAKKVIAEKKGITLLVIPCWWDGKTESIVSTIKFYRKDLLPDYKDKFLPIPNIPPPGYFYDFQGMVVPGIGDLMCSSSIPPSTIVPASWWISEKYDGYRAFWHPEHESLYTRLGRKLKISYTLFSLFPKMYLDGEIWAGRGLFEKAMQTLKNSESNTWESVRFVVFDTFQFPGDEDGFENRINRLFTDLSDNPFIIPITCVLCKNRQHMRDFLNNILVTEGEGIIMRKVESVYKKGRSNTLVKLKAVRDQEALCVGVLPDSYLLKLPNDITFLATLKKEEKESEKPQKGDVVTFMFKYYSSNGQPNNAEILRVRRDMLWRDMLHSPSINKLNETAVAEKNKYHKYLELEDVNKVQDFLNQFACNLGRDPFSPRSWSDITTNHIKSQPWGAQVLKHYGWNMQNLLISVYPNIGLEPIHFGKISRKFWDDPSNLRKYLDQIAAKCGFDPLIASNWYNHVSHDMFKQIEKGYILQRGYKKVLAEIYGEFGVKEDMFDTIPMHYYDTIKNRQNFFKKVALAQGLNPDNMDDWYSLSSNLVHKHGGQYVLKRYNRSIYAVVQDIFPHHVWDESKFTLKTKKYWNSDRIRQFFDKYAKDHNFNPLIPENWYSITEVIFEQQKDGKSILNMFYKGSFKQAVKDIYPDVSFNFGLFARVSANFWKNKANARCFFDTLAKKRGFDPLQVQNWYKLPRHIVQSEKSGRQVLATYGDSLVKTLTTLYPELTFDYQQFPKVLQKKFVNFV
eukprot:Phypoly_transcript_03042.p1 GENE.Phypoly_transcript_03042~~Phypoly_transcript_03042.p1  ORF type:complete len:819 (-),score=106.58 Phypoly_transcript_03042:30-2486(-)